MKRKNKLLIGSIPAIVMMTLLVLYEYGISDIYRKADELKEQYGIKMKIHEKYTGLIARKPLLESRIAELKQARKNEENKLIMSPTTAIASANLQNSLKGVITGRGGVI